MKIPAVASVAHAGIKLLVFARRRQDLTPAEYRDYYENSHVPLIKNLTGSAFPRTHERTYVLRNGPNYEAEVVIGEQEDFQYDSMTTMIWRDQAHYESLFALYGNDDIGAIIRADELNFQESAKAVRVK